MAAVRNTLTVKKRCILTGWGEKIWRFILFFSWLILRFLAPFRYVNCASNDEEKNLVAFQYRGGILYRCCRPIEAGHELMVWYDELYAKNLGFMFYYIWNRKCSAGGNVPNIKHLDQVLPVPAVILEVTGQLKSSKMVQHAKLCSRHGDLGMGLYKPCLMTIGLFII